MTRNILLAATAAFALISSAAAADGYWVQQGYYDAWGSWVDASYYVENNNGYGATGYGTTGYYDAWGNWVDTSYNTPVYNSYDHAAAMDGIAAMGAQSTANYLANDAASDARQAQALAMINAD